MKYKVADLEGALPDAAVAKAEGLDGWADSTGFVAIIPPHDVAAPWWPSKSWAIGGPIIDRERIAFLPASQVDTNPPSIYWRAMLVARGCDGYGPTHLIAAMRAFVASKFGEEVELP